ncbi:MAG: MBL fold metallo-hydrolase [Clostridia bacterium]|nr:MBL fold metallo-hydrolase [Clostridia bacterium]
MARFMTLCSSSSGNAVYVGYQQYGILIDAGRNAKQLKLSLRDAGIDPASLKAIFVTHEHTDHVSALRVLASNLHIPVYATGGTLAALNNAGILDGRFPFEKLMPGGVAVGDMQVAPFATCHDAKESCGYRIDMPGCSVGIATDTGRVCAEMLETLSGCDLVLLESNYDEEMLEYGPYPPPLKARIRSGIGHLSNDDCAAAAALLLQSGVRRFVLGHLSRENNTPTLATVCTRNALKRMGAVPDRDFELLAAPVESMGKYMVI